MKSWVKNCIFAGLAAFIFLAIWEAGYRTGYHAGRKSLWEEATAIGAAHWTGDASVPAEQQVREYEWCRPNGSDLAEATAWRIMLQEKKSLADFIKGLTFEHRPVVTKDFKEKAK